MGTSVTPPRARDANGAAQSRAPRGGGPPPRAARTPVPAARSRHGVWRRGEGPWIRRPRNHGTGGPPRGPRGKRTPEAPFGCRVATEEVSLPRSALTLSDGHPSRPNRQCSRAGLRYPILGLYPRYRNIPKPHLTAKPLKSQGPAQTASRLPVLLILTKKWPSVLAMGWVTSISSASHQPLATDHHPYASSVLLGAPAVSRT